MSSPRQHVFTGIDADVLREQRRDRRRAEKRAAGLCMWSEGCRETAEAGRSTCAKHAEHARKARESRIVEMLANGATIKGVAANMGLSVGALSAQIVAIEVRIGRRLKRGKHGRYRGCMTKEQMERADAIDARLGAQPTCQRCGLRGEHECVPDVTAFMRTGTSNLGECNFPVAPAK